MMTSSEHRCDDPLSFWSGKTPDQVAIMRSMLQKQNAVKPWSFPFAGAIKLAKSIQPSLKISQPVLYHGTRFPRAILERDALCCVEDDFLAVHFSRLFHVGMYWGTIRRITGDEGIGAVLILDRLRLSQNFKLDCRRDDFWDETSGRNEPKCSEAEEIIFGRDVTNLHKYLLDVIWIDENTRCARSANRERALRPKIRDAA
jgi:hypothetical protein